jgi:hypothetical protein
MVHSRNHTLAWLALVGLAMPAYAQTQAASKTAPIPLPEPAAFADYRAYADAPIAPWRETNDRVREVGGWRAYARQVQAANAQAANGQGQSVQGQGAQGQSVQPAAAQANMAQPTSAQGAKP